jgi:hypothetical protein
MSRPLALLALLAATALAAPPSDGAPDGAPSARDLYEARDFFALREQLAARSQGGDEDPESGFLRAASLQAFNDPEGSRGLATELLAGAPPAALAARLHHLQIDNHLRLFRYADALVSARSLLALAGAGAAPALVDDAAGTVPLLQALAGAPPQEVEIRGPSRLALERNRRLPVTIGDRERRLTLDTGANLSVLMRSEAEALGLAIRPAGVRVSTSTGRFVSADVALAPRMTVGQAHLRNVAFLVFPDELLTFPDGTRIPGLVGFPVADALGELTFRADDVVEIPNRAPRRTLGNLALDGLELLVRASYGADTVLCRLDTGAAHTVFYEPFYRRYRERLERLGKHVTTRSAGVGGARELPALRLPRFVLTVAAAGVTLRDVDVLTTTLGDPNHDSLDCNLGQDALAGFRSWTINFRDMALVVQ